MKRSSPAKVTPIWLCDPPAFTASTRRGRDRPANPPSVDQLEQIIVAEIHLRPAEE